LKLGIKNSPGLPLQSLLVSLDDDVLKAGLGSSVDWVEQAISIALKVLCCALARERQLLDACSLSGIPSIVPVLSFRRKSQGSSSYLEVSSLQFATLSQLLVSSNLDTRVLCRIADLVGYHATIESHDVSIARAATAIVLYTNNAMPNPTDFADFYPTTEEGELKMATSFGRRLVASGGKVDSNEDVEIVRTILIQFLQDLRRNVKSSLSTSYTLLGFPSRSIAVWNTLGSSFDGDCFAALLYVLKEDAFVFSYSTAEVAAMAFEVFARLISFSTTQDDEGLARVQCAASRLRRADFWRFHLMKILRIIASAPSVYDVNVLHSAAWLFKSLTSEVEALMGNYTGNPQLFQLERVVSALCTPPSEILANFIRFVPLQRLECGSTTFKPSHEALSLSTIKMTGAVEVVDGFELIQIERLLATTDATDELKSFCLKWNSAVAMDCATAHLSYSLHLFLGSILETGNGLLDCIPSIRLGLCGLLPDLLDKLTFRTVQDKTTVRNCDSDRYATATRNLAMAALVVASEAVLQGVTIDGTEGSFDGSALRSVAASAVASSGNRLEWRLADSEWQERTALLGAVLSLIFERSSSYDVENTSLHYVGAATSLAVLSLETMKTSGAPAVPVKAAMVARECLGLLFEKLQSALPSGSKQSFVQRVLSQSFKGSTFAASFMLLIRRLDSDLNHLVLTISTLPGGCQLLLDSGVLDALEDASKTYNSEESKALASSTNAIKIETPLFFEGHLELLVSLMTNCDVDNLCYDIAATSCRVVSNYERVVERTIAEFPTSMHSVHLVTRLAVAVRHFSRRFTPIEPWSKSVEQKMLSLALNVAVHPLPNEFLPALPDSVTTRTQSFGSSLLTISTQRIESWWDATQLSSGDSIQDRRDKAVQMCSYAVEATELARDIIRASRGQSTAMKTFDTNSLAICLQRCCDALMVRSSYVCGGPTDSLLHSISHSAFSRTVGLS
jgi:hypothetical protein